MYRIIIKHMARSPLDPTRTACGHLVTIEKDYEVVHMQFDTAHQSGSQTKLGYAIQAGDWAFPRSPDFPRFSEDMLDMEKSVIWRQRHMGWSA